MEKQQEKEPKTTIYKKNKNQKTNKPRLKSTPTRLRKPLRKLSQQVNVGFRNPVKRELYSINQLLPLDIVLKTRYLNLF